MTRERAEEIRASVVAHHGDGDDATPEERAEIKKFWDRCPGYYSFYDAVSLMARGETPEEHAERYGSDADRERLRGGP